jgi:hypothetical protein
MRRAAGEGALLDRDDQETEYDRLHMTLDREAVIAFAQHRCTLLGHAPDKLIHLAAVADLAQRYAAILYKDADFTEQRYRAQVCAAAGFLHEAMLHGCDFERLVEVADEAVARVVAAVTPDVRQPVPRRVQLLANQVGLAGGDAQLVKLADLRHDCTCYAHLTESDPGRVRDWLEEAREILTCLHQLTGTTLSSRIDAVREEVGKLDRATRAHRRRR